MAVLALDPATASAGTLDGVYAVLVRCHMEANAEEPYRTRAEMEAFLRHPPASDLRDHWTAVEADRCVGFAQLVAARGATAAWTEIVVDPDAQPDDKIVLAAQGCPTQAISVLRGDEKLA